MNRNVLRRTLLRSADHLHFLIRKLNGAADRLTPEQKITLGDCERSKWKTVRPGFVLSTGRSGTLFLNRLLSRSPTAMAVHAPRPELIRASKRAYAEIAARPELFAETFKSAREELLLEAARRGQVFVETNNRITFFAPIIRTSFPKAVFLHLVRHPGDFIRSGIRRQWYSGTHAHDLGRIVPLRGDAQARWAQLTQVERIAWLWNETNQFIEDFKETIPADDCLFIRAEDLFTDPAVAERIFEFLHVERVDLSARYLQRPVNVQRKGQYPRYADWPEEERRQLSDMAPLMATYGY